LLGVGGGGKREQGGGKAEFEGLQAGSPAVVRGRPILPTASANYHREGQTWA